jgi:hypothetical protein
MASTVMCAPDVPGIAFGRQLIAQPSGTAYTVDAKGCVLVAAGDIAWMQSQGFTIAPSAGMNMLFTTGVLTGATPVQVGQLPASAYIREIIVQNLTGQAITGLGFGSSSGASDIVAAFAVAANGLAFVADAALLKRVFSTSAPQAIWAAATNWNSANINITIVYGYF